jgi:hypothetical protein
MKIQIVFQEDNLKEGIKKNDIFTYEKIGNYINTYANGVQIVNDSYKDYSDEEWLSNLINGLNLIKLVVREREKKQATAFLKAVPEKPGQCECLKILNADSLKLISLADTTAVGESEVKNSIKGYYNSINDEFVFETAGDEIDNIEIYDLRGLMEEKLENLRHEGTLIINAVGFSDGFHLAVIKTYNKKEYKLILIKI